MLQISLTNSVRKCFTRLKYFTVQNFLTEADDNKVKIRPRLCVAYYLQAENTKKSAAENIETRYNTEHEDRTEELASRFQQSAWAKRYRQWHTTHHVFVSYRNALNT